MTNEPKKDGQLEVETGPGCGWIIVALIACITVYNLAELYFQHRR